MITYTDHKMSTLESYQWQWHGYQVWLGCSGSIKKWSVGTLLATILFSVPSEVHTPFTMCSWATSLVAIQCSYDNCPCRLVTNLLKTSHKISYHQQRSDWIKHTCNQALTQLGLLAWLIIYGRGPPVVQFNASLHRSILSFQSTEFGGLECHAHVSYCRCTR